MLLKGESVTPIFNCRPNERLVAAEVNPAALSQYQIRVLSQVDKMLQDGRQPGLSW